MLEGCATPDEWNVACAAVKRAREGGYPSDWYPRVLAPGGISDRLKARWKDPHAFDITLRSIPGSRSN